MVRFRLNLHMDGAPSLLLERHQSGTTWVEIHDSACLHENYPEYVALFAPAVSSEVLRRAVEAFNREISKPLVNPKFRWRAPRDETPLP